MQYRQNKTGHVFSGTVSDTADRIIDAAQIFLETNKTRTTYKDGINIIDTTEDLITIKILVKLHVLKNYSGPAFVPIDGFFDGEKITIDITLFPVHKRYPIKECDPEAKGNIVRLLNHEIGHASRAKEISKREIFYPEPDEDFRYTFKYKQHPLEFDAFMHELIFYFRELTPRQQRSFSYKKLFKVIENNLGPEVISDKWRKKIILRLAREGIVLKR